MKLCNLDEVTKFKKYREHCQILRRCAESSMMELKFTGCPDPDAHISLECVRRAVMAECDREIENYETKLKELGVEV